jgi:hypothetical protein
MRPMFLKSWVFKAYFGDEIFLIYIPALLCTILFVPIIFGAWLNSWWWFGVLWAVVFYSLVYFFLVDWFVLAPLLTGVGALFWGASGYVFGLFLASHISWAPPPLILAISSYLVPYLLKGVYRRNGAQPYQATLQSTRRRNSSKPARPYVERLINLRRLTNPSVGPLL